MRGGICKTVTDISILSSVADHFYQLRSDNYVNVRKFLKNYNHSLQTIIYGESAVRFFMSGFSYSLQ